MSSIPKNFETSTNDNKSTCNSKDSKTLSCDLAKMNLNLEKACDKRDDYLAWEDYFLAVAFLSAMRSKDPSTQVKTLVEFDCNMSQKFCIF